jgi:hypothetical protein
VNQRKLVVTLQVFLLLCIVIQSINTSKANPVPQVTPSIQPEITPPIITVASPENNSVIHSDTVNLKFTVTAPTSKDAYTSAISKIYCLPNWETDQAIPNHYVYLSDNEHLQLKEINLTLTNIPAGQQSIEIGADGSVTVSEGTYSFQHDSSSTSRVYFTISDSAASPQGENQNSGQPAYQSTSTQIAIIAVIVICVAAIVAVWRNKNQRRNAA